METEAMETCAIIVQQFIVEDGRMTLSVGLRGDVPLSTALGLLELAKQKLILEHQ